MMDYFTIVIALMLIDAILCAHTNRKFNYVASLLLCLIWPITVFFIVFATALAYVFRKLS